MDVFATAFLPGTCYLRNLLQSNHAVIDLGENFIKQTYRSRCLILSSSGPLMITIPLRKNDSKKVLDMEISHSEDWQTKALRAIRSSYSNSPYYEHYQEEFEGLLMNREPKLHVYNQQLFAWILKALYVETEPEISIEYIQTGILKDFRSTDFEKAASCTNLTLYKQVFSHKMPFQSGLSTIDLLFNKGPESLPFLK